MTDAGTVAMPSPDRDEATLLHWEIIDVPLGGTAVPIVEYSVVGRSAEPGSPIVLFLAGGGSCGAQAAKLARLCAERSVSLVMFDLPGHTPPGLLGEAAQEAGASSPFDLIGILRTRAMPTGLPAIHFGPAASRRLSDEAVEGLQGAEHILAVLNLLRSASFGRRIWRGVRVDLVCSAGDRLAPEALMHHAAERLGALGADIRFHRVEGDLPHMFFMFDAGAAAVAEVIGSA